MPESDHPLDEKVRVTIEAIRPAVQADGGDIMFHGIDDDGVVTVELVGACVSCPASTLTLWLTASLFISNVPASTRTSDPGVRRVSARSP